MPTAAEQVPTMYIESLTIGESGYVRDDTRNSSHPEVINTAEVLFIPNEGKRAEPILDDNGKETGRYRNVAIRYIKDCPYIDVDEQKKFGYEPSKISNVDTILIKKGKSLLKREGDVALYDYIQKVFYNESAPNRPRTAKALIRVVEIEKGVSQLNEGKFIQARAIGYVETLVLKQNTKPVTYKYKEAKIDSILTALNKFGGDTYGDKIRVLTDIAEREPMTLLDMVSKLDNLVITELTHAIELNVVQFKDNVLQYVQDSKVIGPVGTEHKSQVSKIEAAAELLRSPEFASHYQEIKAKLEIAKEKQLK